MQSCIPAKSCHIFKCVESKSHSLCLITRLQRSDKLDVIRRGCSRDYRETERLKSAGHIKAGSVNTSINTSKPVEHLGSSGDTFFQNVRKTASLLNPVTSSSALNRKVTLSLSALSPTSNDLIRQRDVIRQGGSRNYRQTQRLKWAGLIKAGPSMPKSHSLCLINRLQRSDKLDVIRRGCSRDYRETKRLKSAGLIKAGSVNASKPVEHLGSSGDTVTEGYVQTLAASSVSAS
ncbi:hypothetical protein CDAR_380071 [Caerostris darwini]|uniref:Ribosomal protein S14 n=1 Tax=Caerostris darwini TaxID=1538125 RepID=A0AAV4WFE4_9ARAC|nr:hypothetical protein CDAR_380071 [Caerostris darwini]